MHIEYIPNGSYNCPLIRLFDFEADEARELHNLFARLASGTVSESDLAAQSWMESVGGCRMTLHSAARRRGIVKADSGNATSFACLLTLDDWETVAERTLPFCKPRREGSYAWLDDTSPLSLLLSVNGSW